MFCVELCDIFNDGFEVDQILKNITLHNPDVVFVPGDTLIFFDELQDCPNCATSLKSFRQDGRFDVICSGSLMGINYQEIESNSVGNKEDYEMHSLDFEEFLWAHGYKDSQIQDILDKMLKVEPLSNTEFSVLSELFKDYMIVGGMSAIVQHFVENRNYSGILALQRQILADYREDISKYAEGFDKARILNAYNKISVFLGNENKKFQTSKVASGARNREYAGVVEWLESAGIVNVSYQLSHLALPLKGNYEPDNFRLYFADIGLLIGSLDEEAQEDLRENANFDTYKGAIYENVIADMLVKDGYDLYFYKSDHPQLEMDFFVRDKKSLIPIEVKASDGASLSLKRLIDSDSKDDIDYGIKFCNKNIGWNGKFYTFPHFLIFLLRDFLKNKK